MDIACTVKHSAHNWSLPNHQLRVIPGAGSASRFSRRGRSSARRDLRAPVATAAALLTGMTARSYAAAPSCSACEALCISGYKSGTVTPPPSAHPPRTNRRGATERQHGIDGGLQPRQFLFDRCLHQPEIKVLLRKSKLAPSAPTRRFVTDRSRTTLVDQARSFD